MIVQGLNNNRYLSNNPIWVDITGAGSKVQLNLTSLQAELANYNIFTYYTFNGNIQIDISEIVKALLPEPNHPENAIDGQVISSNTISQTLTFTSGADSFSVNRVFIRGGRDTMSSNQFLTNGQVLKESDRIPVWQGYQSAKYTLTNNQIIFSNILANSEVDRRRVTVCNPVFLRFLNKLGGYSFWLFEEWEMTEKTTKTQRIDRRGNPLDLGLETAWELKLNTRAENDYKETLSALLRSPEVYVYNAQNILNTSDSSTSASSFLTTSKKWTRIYTNGGSMKWNAFEEINEFSFSFDLLLKNKTALVW